jgi:hypothetical protein
MEASRVVYGLKALLAALLVVALLMFASAGTALAHNLVVSPPGESEGICQAVGGGPAHERAAAPDKESSEVVSLTLGQCP